MPNAWVGTFGLRGFDANFPLTALDATAFKRAGFRFAIRYLPRTVQGTLDFTAQERAILDHAGLGCMAVQHVESESAWLPEPTKGKQYGQVAGLRAAACGLAKGTTVWLDLEGVSSAAKHEDTIRYCNYWFDQVALYGFQPGLYVGWHCGLTPKELRERLRFTRYWAAYNLNGDEKPEVCGTCMKQGVGSPPRGIPFQIDTDLIVGDLLGRYPTLSVPDEWDPR